MKRSVLLCALICFVAVIFLSNCSRLPQEKSESDNDGHTPPTKQTFTRNSEILDVLPFSDMRDIENAKKGLIAAEDQINVLNVNGDVVWDTKSYGFINKTAPPVVNPSLWRQEKLNNIHGLFKVSDGIYQLRGYDLSNLTLIKSHNGWIIVDPLTSKETASAAMAFAAKHLNIDNIVAVIYTHSHIDHFGGILGVVSAEDVKKDKIRIIAPQGFMESATSENLIAGTAMGRRAMYMYGKRLARSDRGHIGSGLGKGPAFGAFGIIEPTEIIDHTLQEKNIDGVRFVFQSVPGSEAPAEMTFYLPEKKAFCGAEIVSCTFHNLYTLRGAKVRDAKKWSEYIAEAMELFKNVEVYFGTHHWPMWGNPEIMSFLEKQRDLYKYTHDQTVRMFNNGMTPLEIAESMALPDSLGKTFFNRGYYGTIRHNSRAVYQSYLGWYDGNPVHLNPLPPVEAGKKYVESMGGAGQVLEMAEKAFEEDEYRWAAEILNHLVFAEPGNDRAKKLLAQVYDQLGYQSESGPWRDIYLTGAYELRHGPPETGFDMTSMEEVLMQTPISRLFDTMAVRLKAEDAEGKKICIKIIFTDLNESYQLNIKNSVFHHRELAQPDPGTDVDVSISLTRELFVKMSIGKAGIRDTVFSEDFKVEGSKLDLVRFFMLFEKPKGVFNIVTP